MKIDSQYRWDPPSERILKLNFDATSKGNYGEVGYGVAIKDHRGVILRVLYGILTQDRNNIA